MKFTGSVIVTFSKQNAFYYNGNEDASWPFQATVREFKGGSPDGDLYLVEDQDSNFFEVTEHELQQEE